MYFFKKSWHMNKSSFTLKFMSHYLSKTSDLEEVFKALGLELVFKAKNLDELNALVKESIEASEEFKTLPSFRRYGILQFVEGVFRGTAKLVGSEGGAKSKGPSMKAPKKSEDVPRNVKKLQPDASWRKHPNGGGWVSSTAYVEASASVGKKAVVCGNARVTERAKIYGAAVVRGDAECYGACHVHGLAVVEGHARVFESARILGKAVVRGSVVVRGMSLVRGNVVLDGDEEYIDERKAPTRIFADRSVGA